MDPCPKSGSGSGHEPCIFSDKTQFDLKYKSEQFSRGFREKSKNYLQCLLLIQDPGCLSRIPDPNFFHHGSRTQKTRFRIPAGSTSKNLRPTKLYCFYALGNMIRDVHTRSRSWFFTHPGSRIQGSKRIRNTTYPANDKVRGNGHVDAGDIWSCLLVELSRKKKKQTDLAYDKVRGNGHVDAGDVRSCLLVEDGKGRLTRVPRALRTQQKSESKF